jgi:hypothetical protein
MNSRKRIKATQMGCSDPTNGQVAKVRLNSRDVGSCRMHKVSCRQLDGEPYSIPRPFYSLQITALTNAVKMPHYGEFIGE